MSAGRTVNSQSQDWGTPQNYVDAVRECFGGEISLDPCSNVCSLVKATVEYRLPERDGLVDSWNFPTIFVNPPYGRDKSMRTSISDWLERCANAFSENNSEVLGLVPVATNTGHWKEFVFRKARSICFLYDTRLKFLENGQGGGKGAPMSCAMIYWGRDHENFAGVFKRFGAVLNLQDIATPDDTSSRPRRQRSLKGQKDLFDLNGFTTSRRAKHLAAKLSSK